MCLCGKALADRSAVSFEYLDSLCPGLNACEAMVRIKIAKWSAESLRYKGGIGRRQCCLTATMTAIHALIAPDRKHVTKVFIHPGDIYAYCHRG